MEIYNRHLTFTIMSGTLIQTLNLYYADFTALHVIY